VKIRLIRIPWVAVILVLFLAIPGVAAAQEEPSECVEMGGLAYDSWISEDAGGSGFPDGETDNDYLRCKACHGWDQLGTDGGYVRRSRNAGRPNAGAGDVDQTSRDISFTTRAGAPVTADMILHAGTGRSLEDGSGSWVPLDDPASPANKADHSAGYTLGNQHPDFSTGGENALTQEQADCLAEFLNFADAGWDAYFDAINPNTDSVLYTIRADADASRGETYYSDVCFDCHGDPSEVGDPFPIEGDEGILEFLADTPHFSEFYNKVRWGHPDSIMTRDALGNPTALDVSDIMLYLQELGGTGFAMNAGLNGNWWNGIERNGEGFQIEVSSSAQVASSTETGGGAKTNSNGDSGLTCVATFYSYDVMGGQQIFLVAVGPVTGNTAEVDVFITDGGMWGQGLGESGVETPFGTGTFRANGCDSIDMEVRPNEDYLGFGFTDLMYPLMPLTTRSGACPSTD
jgi:hypothetical protein